MTKQQRKRKSLIVQEMIIERNYIMANYCNKKLTAFYYKIRLLIHRKVMNIYKKR